LTDSGYARYRPTLNDKPGRVMNVLGTDVERRRIPEYFTEEYFDALSIWKSFKRYGLPFAPLGWAEHPAYIIDIIDMFEDTHAAFMEQESKRKQNADSRRTPNHNTGRNTKRR